MQLLLGLYVMSIGYTRIYLGAHYPSDVVAGWCIAVIWVAVVYALYYGIKTDPEMAERGP